MKKVFIVLFMVAFLVFGAVNVSAEASNDASSEVSTTVSETESKSETENKTENEGAVEELNIDFQPSRFVDNLGKMGIGMVGIFIVMGVVIIVTSALNKATTNK